MDMNNPEVISDNSSQRMPLNKTPLPFSKFAAISTRQSIQNQLMDFDKPDTVGSDVTFQPQKDDLIR